MKSNLKKQLLLILLTLLIFTVFSLRSFSEICCMFSATRYYGWPYPFLTLNKSVDELSEAKLIETEPISSLMKAGWKWGYSTHMTRGILGSPSLSLAADLAFSFILASVPFYILKRLLFKSGK